MANESYSAGALGLSIEAISNDTIKSLDAVIERLNVINKGLGGITTKSRKKNTKSQTTSSTNGLLGWGKKFASIYMLRRIGRLVANIAQKGAEYTETLNLWEVAMGDNLDMAEKFVDKMNDAYGISEKTLMNAQAIFKNMLGSLGEISDATAYALSEGITQMALDYASLYNQTFEQAMTKFQAALAGQVRPIRSVAGYDITENNLYQLYQSLGGQKTMRQLSRTEKQLLSILAIFNQMEASGAVGDLDKTMESYANQSRVFAESWQRVLSYSGVILTYLIQEYQILKYVNAFLLYLGDSLEHYADEIGAIQHFGDPFSSYTDGANEAIDATDELTGKLLDFDKIRALNQADENNIALDQKLLDAISKYQTILENANMQARDLADIWIEKFGYLNSDNILSFIEYFTNILIEKLRNFFSSKAIWEGLINILERSFLQNLIYTVKIWDEILNLLIEFVNDILDTFGLKIKEVNFASRIEGYYNKAYGIPDTNVTQSSLTAPAAASVSGMSYAPSSAYANQNMQNAFYNALVKYGNSNNGRNVVEVYLDGEMVYQNTTSHAQSHGNTWSKA